MKLHLDRSAATNFVTAVEPDYIQVNQTRHTGSLIVLPGRVVTDWYPGAPADLAAPDFERLAELGADIVLLGTGRQLRFPHPRLTASLMAKRIGLEVMDTAAACRTYNILAGEGRNVAAALVLE